MQQNPSPQQNELKGQASLYLQQHAGNPVNWHPWGKAIWERAEAEQRLVIVSIGYSTCHWCHVMERESFENAAVADFMNAHFLSIKVDREEHPEVDSAYMTAVQLMTRQGGWPLNVVCLPDGRPVWGGTYFPAERWVAQLRAVRQGWQENPKAFIEYAEKLASGVAAASMITPETEPTVERTGMAWVESQWAEWQPHWDLKFGGQQGAPKFPMPPTLNLLITQAGQEGPSSNAAQHLVRTLRHIEAGGIHDHVGGGFARYAVDDRWHIPHFEKMLCDNGQLLEVFSRALLMGLGTAEDRNLWHMTVRQTADWMNRELGRKDGAFGSGLDADSPDEIGEIGEGCFYVWPEGEPAPLGFEWAAHEDLSGQVLVRQSESALNPHSNDGASKLHLASLQRRRDRRPRPVTDWKAITAWNALAIRGLTACYRALGRDEDAMRARRAGHFLLDQLTHPDGTFVYRVHHLGSLSATGHGCLADWAALVSACRCLYECTFETLWLERGEKLLTHLLGAFSNDAGMLNMVAKSSPHSIFAQQQDWEDGVMPSGGSEAAVNLWWFGRLLDKPQWIERSRALLTAAQAQIQWLPNGAQWAELAWILQQPQVEIGILGGHAAEVQTIRKTLQQSFGWPHIIWYGGHAAESVPQTPWVQGRISNTTTIFICQAGVCQLPCHTTQQAIASLEELLSKSDQST